MPDVRRLRSDQRDRALSMVVSAFRADPQVRWYFPDDTSYDECAGVFFGVLMDLRLDGGEVWVVDDCAAVAMWNPPGGNLIGPDVAGRRYAQALGCLPQAGNDRVLAVDHAVDRLLPGEPHWYLGVLACRSDRRGQGLASAVLEPVLASADRAGLPVALETSTKANVAYYTRRGFAVAGEAAVTDDLTVYVMRREPLPS